MTTMTHTDPWLDALADLKDAAHAAGVGYDATDRWAIRHLRSVSVFGAYDDAGAFVALATVFHPQDVRALGKGK